MEGILLLAHGSRSPQAAQTMEAVADLVRRRLPGRLIVTAYMEFCAPDIAAGLAMLLEQGATAVRVVPYFLFEGIHMREDIPSELAAFQQQYPNLPITLTRTLGADPRLAEIVIERIEG